MWLSSQNMFQKTPKNGVVSAQHQVFMALKEGVLTSQLTSKKEETVNGCTDHCTVNNLSSRNTCQAQRDQQEQIKTWRNE